MKFRLALVVVVFVGVLGCSSVRTLGCNLCASYCVPAPCIEVDRGVE